MKRKKQIKVGTVISRSGDKSVVVLVEKPYSHPLYKKIINRRSKFMAHDELNQCNIGDKIRLVESRPLSRRKRWRVVEILEKNKGLKEGIQ
ncbi:MAG: 30S ribosomal protein S17 [Acidobacteriota bacterium]